MITKVESSNLIKSRIAPVQTTNFNAESPIVQDNRPLSQKQKAVVLGSAAAGMLTVLGVLAKQKGFSLNPKKIFSTPVKNWAIFKYNPKSNIIKYKEPQILSLAAGSVAGGFAGGMLVDSKNRKAKQREALNQMLGNILVPVGVVGLSARFFGKHMEKLSSIMPKIPTLTASGKNIKLKSGLNSGIKILNSCIKNLPNGAATLLSLICGIFAGNRVSNFINDKMYHKKVERNVRATDFAPHLDDVCMSISLMNESSKSASFLARFIPPALVVPGFEVGKAQNK